MAINPKMGKPRRGRPPTRDKDIFEPVDKDLVWLYERFDEETKAEIKRLEGKSGRRQETTKEQLVKMCFHIRRGDHRETAAGCAGISRTTLYRTLRRARGEDATAADKTFLEAIEFAEDQFDGITTAKIAMCGDWRALAWLKERRSPQRWGAQAMLTAQSMLRAPNLLEDPAFLAFVAGLAQGVEGTAEVQAAAKKAIMDALAKGAAISEKKGEGAG
jgi:predicted DNA-binding protein (UPF0251 family)